MLASKFSHFFFPIERTLPTFDSHWFGEPVENELPEISGLPVFLLQPETEKQFIPRPIPKHEKENEPTETPESVVFDKADEAESIERLTERHDKYRKQLTELKESLSSAEEGDKVDLENKIEVIQKQIERLSEYITKRKENGKEQT